MVSYGMLSEVVGRLSLDFWTKVGHVQISALKRWNIAKFEGFSKKKGYEKVGHSSKKARLTCLEVRRWTA
jgi:hypothetical protein